MFKKIPEEESSDWNDKISDRKWLDRSIEQLQSVVVP